MLATNCETAFASPFLVKRAAEGLNDTEEIASLIAKTASSLVSFIMSRSEVSKSLNTSNIFFKSLRFAQILYLLFYVLFQSTIFH